MKPSSLQEAVEIIMATFPAADLQTWASRPEISACIEAHFGLGMWIRNNWVYGDGSPLASKIMETYWWGDADKISEAIIKALWKVLNGSPCPTIEEAFHCQ